ncbi:cell division protein PerM [Tsukamurella ocularis]|uniref:cell division protein PerM n=1 Tax=Tsukamurella ocularis TaxID=1970234 RepID=UPI0039EE2064
MIDSARAAGPGPSETRPLFVMAFGPSLVTLASTLLVGVAVLLTTSTGLGAIAPTVAGLWLAVHQVPVTISDITLGVLPLIPTIALVVGVARAARRAGGEGRPLVDLRSVLLCAIAGPALFTAIALAVVNDAAGRYTIGTPPPLTAFVATVAVHFGAALVGLAPAYWRDVARFLRIPAWVDDCARLAGRALLTFGAVGLAIVVVRLVIRWETVFELVRSGNDAVGMISLVLLSLLYLPNAVIAAAALPLGATVDLGPISMSVFSAVPGRAPGIPILAVLPQGPSPWYLLPLLAVPAFVAVRVGRRCAARSLDLGPTVTAVAATAALTATGFAAAAFLAGGELGGFGYAGADLLQVFGFTLGWVGLVGVLAALVLQQAGESRAVRAARRAEGEAPSGYTTYADEADVIDDGVTVEIEPAERGDHDDDRSEPEDDAADTGDFDALADQPTEEVRPAARPEPRQAVGPAATKRERDIADIEELDSYTFGQ